MAIGRSRTHGLGLLQVLDRDTVGLLASADEVGELLGLVEADQEDFREAGQLKLAD